MSRIAVVGVGAIGGVLAAHAAQAGHELVLCARRGFERLVVEGPAGKLEVALAARTDPADVEPAEWVLLAIKQPQTLAAAPWLRALCGPRTQAVVVAQNGVEHESLVRPLVGATPILPVVIQIAAEGIAPGRVHHQGFGRLTVPDGSLGRAFAALFAGTGIQVSTTDDFPTAAWRKLCGNVFANPITALTGQRLEVLRRSDLAELARGLVAECVAVGRCEGATLADDLPERVVAGLAAIPPGTGSSMLYDRLAGRPLEHDAITGAVVRLGRRHGIPTPLNTAVLALLAAISDAATDSTP